MDCLSKKFACYLAFCAFALTFLIGLGAGVPPLSLVGRALTGGTVFWVCGLALGSVVAPGLVETMDEGDAGEPTGRGGTASRTTDGSAAKTAVPEGQQQESAAPQN